MSLNSLVSAYVFPTTALTQARADHDAVAEARMLAELSEAVESELLPAAIDRTLTRVQNNDMVRVYNAFYPDIPLIGTIYGVGGPATVQITSKQFKHIRQMAALHQGFRADLKRLRGESPTADGVVDPATAIYPGTFVWTVRDDGGYAIFYEAVVEDDGTGLITVSTDGGDVDLERYRVHFEYTDAEVDLVTAEYVDGLSVGDTLTDGTDSWDILVIDHDARTIKLDNLTPSGLTITFEDAFADWTLVP